MASRNAILLNEIPGEDSGSAGANGEATLEVAHAV